MIHHLRDLGEGIFLAGVVTGIIVTMLGGGLVHLIRKFRKHPGQGEVT